VALRVIEFQHLLKGTSNNPWISILNDTIRHLCVEDLRNSLLLSAIFALI